MDCGIKVCALGILFRNEKILLGKRAKHRTSYPNVWDMIGGHSENTETPKQTLIRELQEEIGVHTHPVSTHFNPI